MPQNKTAGQVAMEAYSENYDWNSCSLSEKHSWEMAAKAAREWTYVATLGELAYKAYREELKKVGITYFGPWSRTP